MSKNKKTSVKSIGEVLEILEGIFQSRTHLELEQDFDHIIKKSWSIIENINHHSYDLAIRPKNQLNQFDFNRKSKISISTKSESVQFNVNLKKLNHKNLVIVEIPKELELLSTRQATRHNFDNFKIPLSFRNLSIKSYKKRNQILTAELDELSVNGISLKIPFRENLDYKYADKISFNSINGYSLSRSLEGEVVYLQDFKKDKAEQQYTKIGIKFSKQLEIEKIMRYLDTARYFAKKIA